MGRARLLPLFVAAGLVCLWPCAGRGATALKLGGSGYSGTLSSNPTTRQQQLLCDPTNPFAGSMSTVYDPGVVTLSGISAIQGYAITAAYIEVANSDGARSLLPYQEFFGSESFLTETGYVQVFFGQEPPTTAGSGIPDGAPEGYTTQGHAGVDGQDTHALFFTYLDVSSDTLARYFNYADGGQRGHAEDTLTGLDENGELFTVHHEDISSASIAAALTGPALTEPATVPLPSSAWAGLTLMGVVGAMKFHHRRKAVAALPC